MAVQVKSSALEALIDPAAPLRRLAGDFQFIEGPVWNAAERALYFSDIPGDARIRWSEESGAEVVAHPTAKGNGMVYDAWGRLLVCEHVSSQVARIGPGGERRVLASHHRGKELNSPNDVVTRTADGDVYFTDPEYGRTSERVGRPRPRQLDFQGVYRVPADGGEAELLVDEAEFDKPNGLCFSPDQRLLYVDDSRRAHIKVFDVAGDGTLSNRRLFFEGIGTGEGYRGIPDGMKCDERGDIWVTGPGGVWVIGPGGEHLGVIEVPESVANLAWGGPEWQWLFLTGSTSLYVIETRVGPAPLPYHGVGGK